VEGFFVCASRRQRPPQNPRRAPQANWLASFCTLSRGPAIYVTPTLVGLAFHRGTGWPCISPRCGFASHFTPTGVYLAFHLDAGWPRISPRQGSTHLAPRGSVGIHATRNNPNTPEGSATALRVASCELRVTRQLNRPWGGLAFHPDRGLPRVSPRCGFALHFHPDRGRRT